MCVCDAISDVNAAAAAAALSKQQTQAQKNIAEKKKVRMKSWTTRRAAVWRTRLAVALTVDAAVAAHCRALLGWLAGWLARTSAFFLRKRRSSGNNS